MSAKVPGSIVFFSYLRLKRKVYFVYLKLVTMDPAFRFLL